MAARKITGSAVCAALALGILTGCSSTDSETARQDGTSAALADPQSEEALKQAAHTLNVLAAQRNYTNAWAYYTKRCQDKIGSLEAYKSFMDLWLEDRHPQYDRDGVSVRITGTSAQVVTVDKDPAAPAHTDDPRTWTFTDNHWLFDNC
ncbi:hypothetical protein [Nocardia sp. NPDC050406]|uniref:hypothetical protein n=1 Tax=Nocardia sp. NPDC050406 TaxID=3364318 RepID=UPI0037B81A95